MALKGSEPTTLGDLRRRLQNSDDRSGLSVCAAISLPPAGAKCSPSKQASPFMLPRAARICNYAHTVVVTVWTQEVMTLWIRAGRFPLGIMM